MYLVIVRTKVALLGIGIEFESESVTGAATFMCGRCAVIMPRGCKHTVLNLVKKTSCLSFVYFLLQCLCFHVLRKVDPLVSS